MTHFTSSNLSFLFHIYPPSLITLGIEASMMTSDGTCKLVIPFAELTIARPGLLLYVSKSAASISAYYGCPLIFSYTSPSPLFTLTFN